MNDDPLLWLAVAFSSRRYSDWGRGEKMEDRGICASYLFWRASLAERSRKLCFLPVISVQKVNSLVIKSELPCDVRYHPNCNSKTKSFFFFLSSNRVHPMNHGESSYYSIWVISVICGTRCTQLERLHNPIPSCVSVQQRDRDRERQTDRLAISISSSAWRSTIMFNNIASSLP